MMLTRVQRGRRILKDHANLLTAVGVIPKSQRMIVNQQFAAGGFHHARQHLREGRLPGAVLADNRQRLPFAQGKTQRFNRLNRLTVKPAGAVAKGLTELANFQQCFDHFTFLHVQREMTGVQDGCAPR